MVGPLALHGRSKPYRVARPYKNTDPRLRQGGHPEARPGRVRPAGHPSRCGERYEEKRRRAMEPLLEGLESMWGR